LIVSEAKSAIPDLFLKNAVLLDEVFDGPLLVLIQPTRDAGDDACERIKNRGHCEF